MDRTSTIMWVGTVRSLPLAGQLQASAAAGCDALSITPYHYALWLSQGLSTEDMLMMAADSNVRLAHLDPYCRWATHWKPDNLDPSQFPPQLLGFTGDDFFRIADALRVDSMSAIVTCPASQVSVDQLIEGFAETCDRAAGLGVRCDLEFIPFWGMQDLRTAWNIVRTADKTNSGIAFDFWHYFRGKPDSALLETIPGDKISTVQVTDADARLKPGRTMLDDNSFFRVPPGEGGLPIVDLLKQLDRIGGLNRLGPEIFSAEFDSLSADEIGKRCRASLAKLFGQAGLPHRFDQSKSSLHHEMAAWQAGSFPLLANPINDGRKPRLAASRRSPPCPKGTPFRHRSARAVACPGADGSGAGHSAYSPSVRGRANA